MFYTPKSVTGYVTRDLISALTRAEHVISNLKTQNSQLLEEVTQLRKETVDAHNEVAKLNDRLFWAEDGLRHGEELCAKLVAEIEALRAAKLHNKSSDELERIRTLTKTSPGEDAAASVARLMAKYHSLKKTVTEISKLSNVTEE